MPARKKKRSPKRAMQNRRSIASRLITGEQKRESQRSSSGQPGSAGNWSRRETRVLLFADAVRYSRLTERQYPLFVKHFMGMAARIISKYQDSVLLKRTAGDGLFLVFKDVVAAGKFALELRDSIGRAGWSRLGLPSSLDIRIALHIGSSHAYKDPITGQRDFVGTHVNRAARMEPVTPPGHVYVSDAFAASTGHKAFRYEFVGEISLAKNYGSYPIYDLRGLGKAG